MTMTMMHFCGWEYNTKEDERISASFGIDGSETMEIDKKMIDYWDGTTGCENKGRKDIIILSCIT